MRVCMEGPYTSTTREVKEMKPPKEPLPKRDWRQPRNTEQCLTVRRLRSGVRAEHRPAADACQRPLVPRSRCQARLRPDVRHSQLWGGSHAKACQEIFALLCCCCPPTGFFAGPCRFILRSKLSRYGLSVSRC